MIAMTPQQASWIRRNVWPPACQKSAEQLGSWKSSCSCQRSVAENSSGVCASGEHERCNWGGTPPRRIPEAYLCIASGATYWFALASVWEEHHAHWANCPCSCHTAADDAGLFPIAMATAP